MRVPFRRGGPSLLDLPSMLLLATVASAPAALAAQDQAPAQETNPAPAQTRPKQGDPVPESLLGSYEIVSGESDGQPLEPERIAGTRVRITPDTIVSTDRDGKNLYVALFNLDTKQKPWRIGLTEEGGPKGREGLTARGLIEQDGATVRLIYTAVEGPVPATFKTQAGGKQNLFVLKKMPSR